MDDSVKRIWDSAKRFLKERLQPTVFELWFGALVPAGLDNGLLRLAAPTGYYAEWLKDNYSDLLHQALLHAAGRPLTVEFCVDEDVALAVGAPTAEVRLQPTTKRNGSTCDFAFNPKCTFETFVVGDSNNFAHAAALAVAQEPGRSYNPLFLHGGTGLGKTHLLHAIGQYVLEHKKGFRVAYLSSERFTNEFIDAIQNNQLVRFRRKYRQADLLLIDDIHFLSGKERIQEEFFHTFNALHEARKQIVLTSDRPAREIAGLESRLVSRFEWGLSTDLQPPDVETRVAILRKKERLMGADTEPLPDEVIHFIARHVRSNVRRLEGALTRVVSFRILTGQKITVELATELLRETLEEEGRQSVTMEAIQKTVAEFYDIRLADMTSRRRPENIAFPRQVAMYLARTLTQKSLSAIGEAFGGRDHGTVLHACRTVEARMEVDPRVAEAVRTLQRRLMY